MLTLLAASQPLVLDKVSLNLTQVSPLSGDSTSGGYVFSVSVPYEPNARAFGFPFALNSMQPLQAAVPGRIMFNGTQVQDGLWYARSSMAKTIELEMVIGGGHFNTLVDGKKVGEVFAEKESIYPSLKARIDFYLDKTYPEINYNFPAILNKSFYGEEVNPLYSGIMNLVVGTFDDKTVNFTTPVPQFYLLYIIKKLFTSQGYTPTGPVLDDDYLQKAMLYNNYAIDDLQSVFFFAAAHSDIQATPFTVIWDTSIIDPQNLYDETTGKYTVSTPGVYQVDVFMNGRAEVVGCKYMIIRLNYNGVAVDTFYLDVSGLTAPQWVYVNHVFNYEILPANVGHDMYITYAYLDAGDNPQNAWIEHGSVKIVNKTNPKVNVFAHDIEYKNHMPDLTIKEFLTAFYTAFQIVPFFDHLKKTVDLQFIQDLLGKRKTVPLENGLLKDTLKVYPSAYKGLTIKFNFQGPDDLLKDNFIIPETVKGTVDTFLELPEEPGLGDVYFINSLNGYYEYAFFPSEEDAASGSRYDPGTPAEETGVYEWICICDLHEDQIYDDGSDEISTQLAPMLMRYNLLNDLGRNLPSIEAAGTSHSFGIENSFPLRIMFESAMSTPDGTLEIDGSNDYLLATTTPVDTQGNSVQPIYYRMDNLITRYWLPVISWYKRRVKIEFDHLVTPQFIANLDMKSRFFFLNSTIFITQVVTKIKNKLFGPGEFEGWGD